jgi:hypothetical protein
MKVKFEVLCQFPSVLLSFIGVYIAGLCAKGFCFSRPVVPGKGAMFSFKFGKGLNLRSPDDGWRLGFALLVFLTRPFGDSFDGWKACGSWRRQPGRTSRTSHLLAKGGHTLHRLQISYKSALVSLPAGLKSHTVSSRSQLQ